MPHICFLAPNAFPLLAKDSNIQFAGGAELQQVIIAKGLAERGYPVSMICLDVGQDDRCEIDGITVYRAFRPNTGIPVLRFIWPRLISIWRCLKRANADIYYQRAASMLTGIMAEFCRQHGKKSIFAMAGETDIRFSRDRWLFEYGIRNVDCVTVQNTAQEFFVREKIGRGCALIPNAYRALIDSGLAQPQYVLWVAMIRQIKRPDLFLDIAQALPRFHFVMVGGPSRGEASLYGEISARAETLPNVNFVGFVPYAEIDPYFDKAMLFVSTSESEGFPNTFLQSWARGVPTVSFVDSGARQNGHPVGILVESVEEMTRVIAELMENSKERGTLAEASREYMDLNHAPHLILDRYEDLFRDLMQ